ncbi:MAG: HlyD family efflux transporter periplasmic adaptor subunit, partial [Sulfurimonas sp.]
KAPTNGVVQKLYVNTIGGSVKPAQDLLEIVPTDTKLIIETKVLPKDIAFIYHAQKAKIKFSAFDFSIYGGLEGRVINISPDTITEKDNKTFYIVNVETDQNYIEKNGDKKFIIPGMVADVDIITGKKSVLNYILKPILKTKTYTFTER